MSWKALNLRDYLMMNQKKGFSLNNIKLAALCVVILSLIGCASTVTIKDVVGDELQITLTFRSTIDTSQYNYFMLFSKVEVPKVPILDDYFIAPGRIFDDAQLAIFSAGQGIQHFYQEFFSSWSDYVVVESSGPLLYNSGAASFDPTVSTTNAHLAIISNSNFNPTTTIAGNKIMLSFQVAQLSNVSEGDTLFFNFVTIDKELTTQSGFELDILDSSNKQIVIRAITLQDGSDLSDNGIDGAADLISWEVKAF